VDAFSQYGMKGLTEAEDPFNVFQTTPSLCLKALNCPRPGDWCEFEVLKDCIIVSERVVVLLIRMSLGRENYGCNSGYGAGEGEGRACE